MEKPFQPRPVYLADSFMLPVGRYDGRHRERKAFLELAASIEPLLVGTSLSREEIGCVVVGSQNPFAFSEVDNVAAKVAGVLGISGVKSLLIDTASSSGASAFEAAYMEIASGRHDAVLAVGIQKMSDVSTAEATRIVAGVIDREEAEYGLTMPACGALVARALMAETGLDRDGWTQYSARLTERAQRFAAANPDAHLAFEIPVATYLADIDTGRNYLYYDPLRYYDFCPMSDGVAACLLTASPREVQVTGVGAGTDLPTIADRREFTTFPATVIARNEAFAMAGLTGPADLEGTMHVNMHDPFNGFGPVNLVDLGVVPRERLLDGLLDDALTGPGGTFPTNLTGGLKGRGHPLGATGMIQIVENHRLIRDGRFRAGLSHSIGGPINNNVVILLEDTAARQARGGAPRRTPRGPALSRPKPPGLDLDSLFRGRERLTVRLVAATTRYHYRSGDPLTTLLIFAARLEENEYRFLVAVAPEARDTLSDLEPGDRLVLAREEGRYTVNDVPVRRFYRKTREGIVELAEATRRLWRQGRDKT